MSKFQWYLQLDTVAILGASYSPKRHRILLGKDSFVKRSDSGSTKKCTLLDGATEPCHKVTYIQIQPSFRYESVRPESGAEGLALHEGCGDFLLRFLLVAGIRGGSVLLGLSLWLEREIYEHREMVGSDTWHPFEFPNTKMF